MLDFHIFTIFVINSN